MCSVKPQNDLSHKGQAVEEWADLHFFRPIGIRIARALQPTGISADQVTLWSLVIGLVAGHLFAYQDRWTNVIGFVLFIVSDIFDSADGQLARLRGSSTRFGRALDGISDNLRFVNLYFHLIYRLIHAGFWGPGAFLLVAAAGLAHTFQSAAIDFVRNAFLYIGVGALEGVGESRGSDQQKRTRPPEPGVDQPVDQVEVEVHEPEVVADAVQRTAEPSGTTAQAGELAIRRIENVRDDEEHEPDHVGP